MCQFHNVIIFIVTPVSAVRPSSVTNNLKVCTPMSNVIDGEYLPLNFLVTEAGLTAETGLTITNAMFLKNNPHWFKTNGYHFYEPKNGNKFEKIIHRTSEFKKSP